MKNRRETMKRRQFYIKQIMLDLGKGSYNELKEITMDQEEWKNILSLNQSTDC